MLLNRLVIVDPQGNIFSANIVPFTIKPTDSDTLAPTDLDNPTGSATFHGYIHFANGSTITYYYEYSPGCNPNGPYIKTPAQTMTANGLQQLTGPATVTGLPSGTYCYRLVVSDGHSTEYGHWEPFVITNTNKMTITDNPVIVPATNNCVIFRGHMYIPPGANVTYYYKYGMGYNTNNWTTVLATPAHISQGSESANNIMICNLPNGDYNYEVYADVNGGGTSPSYKLAGGLKPFSMASVSKPLQPACWYSWSSLCLSPPFFLSSS